MSGPSVFISYSHKDEIWKDRLVTHLGVLDQEGILDLWEDRRIEAGDDWKPEIEKAINKAAVAILMISANFLTSKFILGEEVPKLLKRRTEEGVRIIPLIVKPCAWTQVSWLSPIQARPKDGRPLSAGNENQIDTDLTALAEEIAKLIKRAETIGEKEHPVIPPDKISLAKLPSTSPDLFGREKKLQQLDVAWNDQNINVLSLVAWGGVGKTALVNKWLSNLGEDFHGAASVYGWSFYSQGAAEGRQVSADQFIAAALEWFGDPDVTKGSPWDKGERLADLIKQQRTLLILDGLEPLQNPPPVETGKIKDPGLTSMLRELARRNLGLVVISTRLAVDDLKDFKGTSALEIDLETLSDEAGAAYLKFLGADGIDEERKAASRDFGGHALALTLLGRYLKVVHGGDIRKRGEIPHVMDEQKQGAHARRVMESYEVFLKGKPELDILRLMGLFDRPAEKGALDELLEEPAIEGLTDTLQQMSAVDWKYTINNLRDLRLLAQEDQHSPDALDCHPLLREYFGEKLKVNNPEAWRKGHIRLFIHYSTTARPFPKTTQEMALLYAAVMHGCQAGRHQEAFDDVYWRRIQRGNKYFNMKDLGAIGADLALISGFFDLPWSRLVGELREDIKGLLFNQAGFDLRSLGRLTEAVQPMKTAFDAAVTSKDWRNASLGAIGLSTLYKIKGNTDIALTYARQSVELGDRSDIYFQVATRSLLGDVLHQVGHLTEAEAVFHEAEAKFKDWQPQYNFFVGMWGVRYCDLLLSQGKFEDVMERASYSLKTEKGKGYTSSLLDVALDNLFMARVHLLQLQYDPNQTFTEALTYLNRAVDGLRQAGYQEHIARGLLARAAYYRVTGDFEKAQKDLDEAFTIALRGGMGLHLADCHLEYSRLNVERYKVKGADTETDYLEKAKKHLATAKEMIEKMGYHRRDKEVEELEEQLK